MTKKRILILGKLPPPYIGPAVATDIILNSKLRDRYELIHLDTSDHRDINTLGVIDFGNIALALKHYVLLIRLMFQKSPSVVYMPICQTTVGYLRDSISIVIVKVFRKKLVCHLRGGNFKNWIDRTNVFMRFFVRRVHSLVDGQIVLGSNLRGMFDWVLPESRIFVVPNGGDFDSVPENKRDPGSLKVLYLSNFHKTKGILDVLKAIPELEEYFTNVEFIFAGSWRDRETEEAFKAFQGEHPSLPIHMLGPVRGKTKSSLYASSDIFVFPTYYPPEGHPWVIVEAMAAGLPVISTDQGAIKESVMDGVNGFIIEKRDPLQLAAKLKYLIDNPEQRKKMGRAGRRLYLENFTEAKMIEKLNLCIETVMGS